MMSKSTLILGGLALAGALSAGTAQAHDDVQWSVTIGSPIGVPVYAPAPVLRAPVVVAPAPRYAYGGYDRDGYRYHQPTRWDRDGDGIPNWRDARYNPRWDRDGDGVPNWRDHRDDRYHGRDHDRDDDRGDWQRGH